jgi:hypothetical protein
MVVEVVETLQDGETYKDIARCSDDSDTLSQAGEHYTFPFHLPFSLSLSLYIFLTFKGAKNRVFQKLIDKDDFDSDDCECY